MSLDSIVNDAMAAARGGRHDQAAQLCRKVLEQNPDHVGALQVIAFAEHHRHKDDDAVRHLRRAIELRPSDAMLRFNLGVILQEIGRLDEAAQAYRRSLELKRENLGAWNNLGVVLRKAGRYDESLEALRQALERSPESAKTLCNIATTYLDARQPEEAEPNVRRALELAPDMVSAHALMALVHKHLNDDEAALACYRQALQLDPDHSESNFGLANLTSNQGDYETAIRHYQVALKRQPNNSAYLTNMAVAHNRAGDRELAIKVAEQACKVEPMSVDAHYNLAAILSKDRAVNRLQRSKRHLDEVLHLDPNHSPGHEILAIVLSKLGDLDLAIRMAERAVELDPEDVSVRITLGDLSAHDERFEAAIESLEKAVALSPDRARPNRQLGIARLRNHDYAGAENALRVAYQIKDHDQRTIANLGLALAAQGKHDEAEELLGMGRYVTTVELQPPAPFESIEALNQALAEDIRKHPTIKFEPVGLAARKSHLTGELMDAPTPAIQAFDQMLRQAIGDFVNALDTNDDHPFVRHRPQQYKLNLWATLSEDEGYVDSHIHEDSWLSGAYYVQVPSNVGDDEENPAGWFEFGTPSDPLLREIETPLRRVRPREGLQVLFPSYLFHRTLPHNNPEARISIAFDLEPVDSPQGSSSA